MGVALARAGHPDGRRRPGPLVELPEIDARGDSGTPFGPPEISEALPMETLAEGQTGRTIMRNVQTGRTDMRFLWDSRRARRLPARHA